MIIAVDGPAAAGKGTLARALAKHFHYHFLDTGTLYRRVGLALIKDGIAVGNATVATAIAQDLQSRPFSELELRNEDVAAAASIVASIAEVRTALLDFQRNFAAQPPGAVLDGRDIGTVVCPQAEAKLFITASPEIRARRRTQELIGLGTNAAFDTVLADIRARDARDSKRVSAPLVPARDAVVIDTSHMTIEEAVGAAIAAVDRVLPRHRTINRI